METLEPVVLEDHAARATSGASSVVVVRSEVRSIGVVVSIAEIPVVVGVDFHASDGFEKGLTHEGWHCLHCSVLVLDVDVDTRFRVALTRCP